MTDPTDATVLVVDDDQEIVDLYTAVLASEYDLRTATTGSEALEKADGNVDVVLLDRRLPDMSGIDVLTTLRDQGLDFKVIMLTGSDLGDEEDEIPFDEYALKPVGATDLRELIRSVL